MTALPTKGKWQAFRVFLEVKGDERSLNFM